MAESYHAMAERHAAIDWEMERQEWYARWAPGLSPDQCDYCESYSLDNPARGWLRVFEPDSETVWVEQWRGFFANCKACNPDSAGPEPGSPYNCLQCHHMAHDPCHYNPELGPGDMTCYVCGVLKKYVYGNMTADCGGESWMPILEVPPDEC